MRFIKDKLLHCYECPNRGSRISKRRYRIKCKNTHTKPGPPQKILYKHLPYSNMLPVSLVFHTIVT